MDKNNVIGYKNDIPWCLPNDLKHFKNVTSHSTVIMGRKTYESIGRPLPNRRSIILSRSGYRTEDDVAVISSIDDIKVLAKKEEVFVLGGATLYEHLIPYADRLYITRIDAELKGDTYFPKFMEDDWKIIDEKDGIQNEDNEYFHKFYIYSRK